jgi:hypothetical protein
LSVWGELSVGNQLEGAVFAGYSKNLGAPDDIRGSYFGRGSNIETVLRVAPRVQINSGKTRISTELEYTAAGFGKANSNNKGKMENAKTISNIRLLLALYYFF